MWIAGSEMREVGCESSCRDILRVRAERVAPSVIPRPSTASQMTITHYEDLRGSLVVQISVDPSITLPGRTVPVDSPDAGTSPTGP